MSISMRVQQRLNDLDDTLSLYYEKLKTYQDELAITADIDDKFAVKKRIKDEILPYIKQYEIEYAELLANEMSEIEMSSEEAKAVVIELQEALDIVKEKAETQQSEALAKSVEKAQKALKESKTSVEGKLKAAIPIIPGIMSYEIELDAHSKLMNLWKKLKSKFKNKK